MKPKFESAEMLLESVEDYFQWVEDNPLMAAEVVKFQGNATLTQVPKMRAMTISGLCLFIDIGIDTWIQWREKRQDLSNVIMYAEETIKNQKFAGAAADLLNANIIARDLGLRDNVGVEHSGTVHYEKMDDTELDREIAALEQKLEESRVQH